MSCTCCSVKVIRLWDIQLDAKTRATTAIDNCLKVDYVRNVVVVFITATDVSALHILPCQVVQCRHSILLICISQTSSHSKDKRYHRYA